MEQLESYQELTLTCPEAARYLCCIGVLRSFRVHGSGYSVTIILNGERYELDSRISVTDLLTRLDIDPRRVAVEHNLEILKRRTFPDVMVNDGDTVEIVNFVGGG